MFVAYLIHLIHYMYWPYHLPFYYGAVWSNVFVIAVAAPLAWLWSKTKFFPLNLVHKKLDSLHEKHDAHAQRLGELHQSMQELHEKHDRLAEKLP